VRGKEDPKPRVPFFLQVSTTRLHNSTPEIIISSANLVGVRRANSRKRKMKSQIQGEDFQSERLQ
jgi:hypothetical protein